MLGGHLYIPAAVFVKHFSATAVALASCCCVLLPPVLQVPYYRKQTTSVHCGLWFGMTYLAALGLAGAVLVQQGQDESEVKLRMTWVSTQRTA
jgi:hypothetical protein